MTTDLVGMAEHGGALAARHRRHRLDRQLVLLRAPRFQPQAARRPAAGGRRRGLAGAWRRLLPHGQVPGGAGADAGRADLVQVGGLRHLAVGHGPADHRLLFRRPALPDRHCPCWPCRSGVRWRSASPAWLSAGWSTTGCASRSSATTTRVLFAVLFVFLLVLAFAYTFVFSGRGAMMQMGALVGTMMVANVAMVIIPNQRVVVADLIGGQAARSEAGCGRQAALAAQQLSDAAGHLRDDRQPLSAGVRHPLELADLRPRPGDRCGDPPLLQHPPQGPALALVDLGGRRRRDGRDHPAEHGRTAGRRRARRRPLPPSP